MKNALVLLVLVTSVVGCARSNSVMYPNSPTFEPLNRNADKVREDVLKWYVEHPHVQAALVVEVYPTNKKLMYTTNWRTYHTGEIENLRKLQDEFIQAKYVEKANPAEIEKMEERYEELGKQLSESERLYHLEVYAHNRAVMAPIRKRVIEFLQQIEGVTVRYPDSIDTPNTLLSIKASYSTLQQIADMPEIVVMELGNNY
ncbi:MAG: hypothetical protein O3A46_05195 [Candidatus Poribacteria bacterium]|nr:hypothetical protein [Candidatus Poribacteria bacterium]